MRTRTKLVATATSAALAATAAIIACGGSSSTTPVPVPVVYTAALNAANERQTNAVNSSATGTATFSLRSNDSLVYTVTASNLTSGVTVSHIHAGGPTVSGPVVNGFAVNAGITSGTVTSGTIVLSKLVAAPGQISGDSLRVLLNNGNGYVNVHTSSFLAGEIRGQIVKQ